MSATGNTESWLERWWALVVIGFALLFVLFLVYITNSTYQT